MPCRHKLIYIEIAFYGHFSAIILHFGFKSPFHKTAALYHYFAHLVNVDFIFQIAKDRSLEDNLLRNGDRPMRLRQHQPCQGRVQEALRHYDARMAHPSLVKQFIFRPGISPYLSTIPAPLRNHHAPILIGCGASTRARRAERERGCGGAEATDRACARGARGRRQARCPRTAGAPSSAAGTS